MSSGRRRVRMSEAEVDAFLEAGSKLQVATVNPDGTPHLTTLFYVVRYGRTWSTSLLARTERVRATRGSSPTRSTVAPSRGAPPPSRTSAPQAFRSLSL